MLPRHKFRVHPRADDLLLELILDAREFSSLSATISTNPSLFLRKLDLRIELIAAMVEIDKRSPD